jgi:hypothetical protein
MTDKEKSPSSVERQSSDEKLICHKCKRGVEMLISVTYGEPVTGWAKWKVWTKAGICMNCAMKFFK